RGVGGDDDVAHHRKLAAAAQRVACNRGNGRFAALGDAVTADGGEIAGEHVDEGLRLHLLDIGARGKGLFAAGQENASDLVVGFEILERCGDLAKYAEGKRVEHLGAVKGEDSNRAFALDNDAFERAHAL